MPAGGAVNVTRRFEVSSAVGLLELVDDPVTAVRGP
jgi:hypothetical protein